MNIGAGDKAAGKKAANQVAVLFVSVA